MAQETERAEAARRASEAAAAGLAELDASWREAMAGIALDPDATAEAAEAALDAWTRIAEAATAWRGDARRIADMRAAVDAFEAATRELAAELGEATEEPAILLVPRLVRRLGVARDRSKDAAALARQLRERRDAAEAADRRRHAATIELTALQAAAGAPDPAALEETIR
ncbi:hypothetical protein, partial [Falsiroseomonas oryzae]|uniref:hypothetical protein n=1 Tax=Falsiroseomonas oryzae TaxID=2766473 RepID=UPI0022EA4A99